MLLPPGSLILPIADALHSLRRFVSHIQELRPHVIVTYNGDFFDWPFVDTRCQLFGISLYKQLGIRCSKGTHFIEYFTGENNFLSGERLHDKRRGFGG